MTDPEDIEEDLFADLYDGDDSASKPATAPAPAAPEPSAPPTHSPSVPDAPIQHMDGFETPANGAGAASAPAFNGDSMTQSSKRDTSWMQGQDYDPGKMAIEQDENYGPIGIKEDG
ncbi:hypothetical protein BDY21DRAFT_26565 [Lineolata rhizophorae]|uniref:Uncharacterized protein n=1 Tax=Lineolata rhizophorae TaxID=578093 RepID=A0A6A6P0D3_9PEZI|nr:hypothetical protein BDY21DRAFT_26565 [Lineolata rhizophorae]